MYYKNKFTKKEMFTDLVDETRHPKFQEVKPLTISQMLYKVSHNQPISCAKFNDDQLKFNGKFFQGEKLDVIDTILKTQKEFSKRRSRNTLSSTAPSDTANEKKESQRSEES